MKNVEQEEINNFLILYRRYGSLREISRQTGRSVNTIKKYLLPLVKLNLKNIVNSANLSDDILLGTYVGIWMGDGTQYRDRSYTVKICSHKLQPLYNSFIQALIYRLFGKDTCLIEEKDTNRAYIKFRSKFIYYFILDYVYFGKNKTKTVRLKRDLDFYSKKFLKGVLLGLSLSDGHLGKKYHFNVISKELSRNASSILHKLGYNPRKYVHDRSKYGWNDLHMVSLLTGESKLMVNELNEILKQLGVSTTFLDLKKVAPP